MKYPRGRVLIVDDEPQSEVQAALEGIGFQCDMVTDGQEALHRIAERSYGLIVTEVVLPKMNGGQFVIKLCAQVRRPLVIVHTRVTDQEVYWGLKNEGVNAIFYKSSDRTVSAHQIQMYLQERILSPALRSRTSESETERDMVDLLRSGDKWIQNSVFRVEAFRFMIIILACMLFGLGWGNSLDSNMAGICKMFGLCGFAFYFSLELVAYYRGQYRSKLLQYSVERRLSRQLHQRIDSSPQKTCTPIDVASSGLPR